MIPNELRVYLYSTDEEVGLKYADLDIAVYGGHIRFQCVVCVDENQNILPETLRLNSISQSEFLFDGSVAKEDVLVKGASPVEGDNIYPAIFLNTQIYNKALLQAVVAILNTHYFVEYC